MIKGNRPKYYLLYKPYGMLCQFTDAGGRPTLGDMGHFPHDVYPAGRLDYDSEGLVLLTNDGVLKHSLLDPSFRHPRTYLVQVERIPAEDALRHLRRGIILEGRRTLPAGVRLLVNAPDLPARPVPIRFRKNVDTAWIELTIYEGKNRQVRRMTAAVGHPTLRLVRTRIGELTLTGLAPGRCRELAPKEIAGLKESLRRPEKPRH